MIRAAMTQTVNVYTPMPASVDDLESLGDRLDEIRRANVEYHLDLLGRAAAGGARIVCFGELFTGPYFALRRDAFWRGLAEDAQDGATIRAVRAAAADLGVVVVAPIYELDADSGQRYNTAVVIDADGSVLGRYRKVHVPVGSNEAGSFDELFYYAPSRVPQNKPSAKILGNNPYFPVFETAAGRIGVAICYDRHFEGVVSSLARAGAQIVLCPAVTFGAKSQRMWAIEFEVDAARHGVFIGGSNRLGTEPPWNQAFFGDGHFVGPSGRLTNVSDDDRLVIADLDLDELARPDPSGWNLRRDARPEVYG